MRKLSLSQNRGSVARRFLLLSRLLAVTGGQFAMVVGLLLEALPPVRLVIAARLELRRNREMRDGSALLQSM